MLKFHEVILPKFQSPSIKDQKMQTTILGSQDKENNRLEVEMKKQTWILNQLHILQTGFLTEEYI